MAALLLLLVISGGIGLICLAVNLSLLTLIRDYTEQLRNCIRKLTRPVYNKQDRKRKRKEKKEEQQQQREEKRDVSSYSDDVPWEAIFTVDPPSVPLLPEPLTTSNDPSLCKLCHHLSAKRHCRYNYCASCCRGKPDSVCKAHRTGYQLALQTVNDAVTHGGYAELDISFCNLRKCPPHLSEIGSSIVSLNLSNNCLDVIPEDIGSVTRLQELFLQYNHLTYIPESTCNLSYLCELDIKNNNLTHLPEDLGNLSSLNILCLTDNHLTSLPSSIGQLTKLQELTLLGNELTSLPNEICELRELKSLYCGNNKLKNLPDQFGNLVNLEELDLDGCQLVSLPESLSSCQSLVTVRLSNNRLVKLPTQIGNLMNLKEFHLRNNNFKMFPISIKSLHLYTFTAQNNPFFRECQIVNLDYTPPIPFPSLLELAARAVTLRQVPWKRKGMIPLH